MEILFVLALTILFCSTKSAARELGYEEPEEDKDPYYGG